jgi:ABC-type Na+ transport system ATPase subunit NatA
VLNSECLIGGICDFVIMLPVIQVSRVRKTYASTVAVGEVWFEVYDGQIFGLMPNRGPVTGTAIEDAAFTLERIAARWHIIVNSFSV